MQIRSKGSDSGSRQMRDTPVVGTLLAVCGLIFLFELGTGNILINSLALWPLGLLQAGSLTASEFRPWQIVTYGFLHGGTLHLVLNLYALWLFGTPLERRWGAVRFTAFYFTCIIGAALMHLIVAEFALTHGVAAYPVVGASGGIFGLLLAFGMLYPERQLLLPLPPVRIEARWFVLGYGVVELVAGITGTANGMAHFAHLGGMLTGYLLLRGAVWFF
ncbi:MAG: rhomboid family intramembrane serine protease [Gammaproteobacteria bacterium]|nr:rhomboid family intramembrane serine protease [Gammaproteobacteria bacterium]